MNNLPSFSWSSIAFHSYDAPPAACVPCFARQMSTETPWRRCLDPLAVANVFSRGSKKKPGIDEK